MCVSETHLEELGGAVPDVDKLRLVRPLISHGEESEPLDYHRWLTDGVQTIMQQEPPGTWMPAVPPGCIKLSAGYPSPEVVPTADLLQAAGNLVGEEGDAPFHYLGSKTMEQLPEWVLRRMSVRGIEAKNHRVVVTAGACQGIDLVARILLDDSVAVIVEEPTYMEALEMFRNYTSHIVGVPVDEDGLQIDVLEQRLIDLARSGGPRVRLLYTIPAFQNPTGASLSESRRHRLLDLAEVYDFLVLEDDAYGELGFQQPVAPLKALDVQGRVVYAGSLSKVVAPGLRIGWLYLPELLADAVEWFKKDLSHPFGEALTARYLLALDYEQHLDHLRRHYAWRSKLLLSALERHMPSCVHWSVPTGGFFCWLTCDGCDTNAMLCHALAAGVAYIPGAYFYASEGRGINQLRISFSYVSAAALDEGIRRLSRVFSQTCNGR